MTTGRNGRTSAARALALGILLISCTGMVTAQQLTLNVVWTVSGFWNGTRTMTFTNGTWVFNGALTTTVNILGQPCVVNRSESGQGQFAIPSEPNPPSSFVFTISETVNYNNVYCQAGASQNSSGSNQPTGPVTVIATPSPGGYDLSTNTVYAPNSYYGSLMTVTASGFLSLSSYACPTGTSVMAALPPVPVNKLLPVKPLQVTYGTLNLTFSISQSGTLCQAQSNIGHLPVLLSILNQPFQHYYDSVASATLTRYPSGTITGLNTCNFSALGVVGPTNGCLLNGPFNSSATYAQWSTSGFTTQAVPGSPFVKLPVPSSTGPLSFWINISSLGWTDLAMPTLVQTAEPYIHQTLISNLPAIAYYTFIQDPGDVNLLVINRDGMTSGTLPDGRKTNDIIGSLVYDSQVNPAVLLQGSLTNSETVLLTGVQDGSYDLVTSSVAGQNSGVQQEVTCPIALGQMAAYVISSSVLDGVPSQTITPATAAREDLNGDGTINCADAAIAAEHYGSHVGSSDFNAWSDLNGDGVINLLDLEAIVQKIPTGCANQQFVRSVTFASTIADIRVALGANLITNRGIANELSEQITEAESAASKGNESDDVRCPSEQVHG
jgi:hypothetical protein